MTGIIPDIIEALQSHQEVSLAAMAGLRDSAANVLATHRQASALADEQAQLSKQHMQQLTDFITNHVRSLENAETSFQEAIATGFKQASQVRRRHCNIPLC